MFHETWLRLYILGIWAGLMNPADFNCIMQYFHCFLANIHLSTRIGNVAEWVSSLDVSLLEAGPGKDCSFVIYSTTMDLGQLPTLPHWVAPRIAPEHHASLHLAFPKTWSCQRCPVVQVIFLNLGSEIWETVSEHFFGEILGRNGRNGFWHNQ